MKKLSASAIIFMLTLGLAGGAAASDPVEQNQPMVTAAPTSTDPPWPISAPASPRVLPEPHYQSLRPGQAADPALALPPPPTPFDIRRQRTDGPWLGVTERELADGRLVEVHVSGSAQLLGQEVISRPTGHQVHRYYIGRPDAPRSGSDPAREERNREDLRIIYGRDQS